MSVIRSVLGLGSTPGANEQAAPRRPSTRSAPVKHLFDPALVPVASERDARRTAEVLLPYLREHDGSAVVVHVVERRPWWPDPTSPGVQVSEAERMFEIVTGAFEGAGVPVETRLLEGSDVARTILSAAADLDVGSIAFVRRGGGWLVKLLVGDVERGLIEGSDHPVLVVNPEGSGGVGSAGP